jgi:hypothetical protein
VLRPYLTSSSVQIARGEVAASPPRAAWPRDRGEVGRLLEEAGRLRWERRRARFAREAARAGRGEALHRAFFTALGYRRNRGPFRELARVVPAAALAGLPERAIRARLGEAAERIGFWRRASVRPANAPGRRMASAAAILAEGPVDALLEGRAAMRMLVRRGRLGRERAKLIVFHALLPARDAAEGLEMLRRHAPLGTNRREREMLELAPPETRGEVTSVLRQMGVLELRDQFVGEWEGKEVRDPCDMREREILR